MLLFRLTGDETGNRFIKSGFILALWVSLLTQQAIAQPNYELIDLGTLGGAESGANGLNEAGAVVGWSETSTGNRHGFLYESNSMTDLGTLPGGSDSVATDINGDGLVVGFSSINQYGPNFRDFTQAFAWHDGQMRSLGALYCPCDFNVRYGTSNASAVNAQGEIVGSSETVRGSRVRHAFTYEPEQLLDLSRNPGSWSISRANDISNAGHIAGSLAVDAGRDESPEDESRIAILWADGESREVGALPGDDSSSALGVNDAGVMAGWSGSFGRSSRVAVMFRGLDIVELGTLPGDRDSMALRINNAGQIVGLSANADQSRVRAFLWQDDSFHDLNEISNAGPDWSLVEATDINDRGEITGTGLYRGKQRAFLLRPLR